MRAIILDHGWHILATLSDRRGPSVARLYLPYPMANPIE